MAYDEGVAQRVRSIVSRLPGITERKMFGGLAFMSRGHMFVGVLGSALMARVGPGAYPAALERAHVREMDFTGRPMKGYVFVDPQGFESAQELQFWIGKCLEFVASLPPKAPK